MVGCHPYILYPFLLQNNSFFLLKSAVCHNVRGYAHFCAMPIIDISSAGENSSISTNNSSSSSNLSTRTVHPFVRHRVISTLSNVLQDGSKAVRYEREIYDRHAFSSTSQYMEVVSSILLCETAAEVSVAMEDLDRVTDIIIETNPLYLDWIADREQDSRVQRLLEETTSQEEKQLMKQRETLRTTIRCGKCSSTDVDMDCKQTRSMDEPMTVFYECKNPECRAVWRTRG